MSDVVWTDVIDARLRELHASDLSYRDIARAISAEFKITATRNAVIGRSHRINLPLRKNAAPVVKKRALRPRVTLPPPPARAKPWYRQAVASPVPPPDLAPPAPGALRMAQLTPHTCHWPSGEYPPYTYCGEPTYKGSAFCRPHYDAAYVPPRKAFT